MKSIALLVASNVFMTTAWYWHLRFKEVQLWQVVLVSWSLAFIEYCLAVPANRWGNQSFSTVELKVIQEIITLGVFTIFAALYLRERLQWNHIAAFVCIVGAVAFTFLPKK